MSNKDPILKHRFWRNSKTVMLLGGICAVGGLITMLRSLNSAGADSDEYAFIKGIIVPHVLIMVGLAIVLFGIGMKVRQTIMDNRIRTMQEEGRRRR